MCDTITRDDIRAALGRTTYDRFLVYRRSRPSASGLDPEGEGRKPD